MLLYANNSSFNHDILDKRYEEVASIFTSLPLYKGIYLDQALEFCDLIFDNNLDKLKKKLTESEKVNVSLYVDKKTKEFIKVVFESEIGTLNLISNGENNYSYNIVNKDKMVIEGNFSLESNDNKTKYVYHLYYKKTLNNNVLMEGNFNLKYTAKKADAVLDIDVSDSLDLNTMSDLDKLSIYGKILADPNLSKFLPIIRKLI